MKKHMIIALMALLPVACSGSDDAGAKLDPAAVAAGKKVFTDNGCAACHGDNGTGDTPAGKALTPQPRNYTDAAWQDGTTDDQIKKSIVDGTKTAEGTPTAMIAYGDKIKGDDLNNLVTFIRSLKK